jgi:uncharacterized protein (DUF983 family)
MMTQGYTGRKCPHCHGCGSIWDAVAQAAAECRDCGGTGEEHDEMDEHEHRIEEPP